MKGIYSTIMMVAILAVTISLASPWAVAQEDNDKQFVIRWESIEGIIRYTVQVRDSAGTMIVEKTVETNSIELRLAPGRYSIRIAAINKFEKLSFWTDWKDITIAERSAGKFFSTAYPARTGFAIRGGISYNMFLPPWSGRYKNSTFSMTHLNYNGIFSFQFGNSKFIDAKNFIRFMGIELEMSYARYSGQKTPTFTSRLTHISGGANISLSTRMDSVINFSVRVGGGATQSAQYFTKKDIRGFPYNKGSILSLDPYAKAGVSLDLAFLYAMTATIGTDYIVTFYKDHIMQQLRYYVMVGIRI
jgi:hypothetical protein